MKNRLALVLGGVLISVTAHGAESRFDTLVDEQGYPLNDPLYEDIRQWFDQERRGLSLLRTEKYAKAYPLLAEAARHGFKKAQHGLAIMHLNGQGVEKNVLVGVALLGLAAESGDRRLQRQYDKSLKALPQKFQEPVRDQTQYYIAKYGMKVQGIACARVKKAGSNLKQMHCLKQTGTYETWPWQP